MSDAVVRRLFVNAVLTAIHGGHIDEHIATFEAAINARKKAHQHEAPSTEPPPMGENGGTS